MKKIIGAILLMAIAYLALWPVPVEPVAWEAPDAPGYTGDFTENTALQDLELFPLPEGRHGPEDIAIGEDGALYIAVGEGEILRRDPATGAITVWAVTGGRPLGIEPAPEGGFYVADAYRGLLRVTSTVVEVLANTDAAGGEILYADDLDVAPDGSVWFTDASTKFGAEASGGTLAGSYLEILEHGRTGRILQWDPETGVATERLGNISFANGLAMGPTGEWLLYIETGEYALHRLWIEGPRAGESDVVLANLPGFPDNINRDAAGGFLMGLVSKRAGAVDALSGYPFLRKVVQRLPAVIRPKAVSHGFVISLDETGAVQRTWQDPTGAYPLTTGAISDAYGALWITSLGATSLARLPKRD
ncbi:MAG: SMP-30/gluconolactonase/LRE family protein [Pikeienuella sp.]